MKYRGKNVFQPAKDRRSHFRMLKVINIPSENKKNGWQYFWIIGRIGLFFQL